jgi:predicted MFS family arabinose efflux permease
MSWFKDGERGFAMSIRQTAIPVGGALGVLVIPWIAAVYGFRSAFLFNFTICLLATLCVWRWLVEIEKSQATAAPNRPLASPLTRVAVWRVALAGALFTVPLMAVLSLAPVFLTDQRHMNMALISVTVAVIQVGGGILRVVVRRFTDRHKNQRVTLTRRAAASSFWPQPLPQPAAGPPPGRECGRVA